MLPLLTPATLLMVETTLRHSPAVSSTGVMVACGGVIVQGVWLDAVSLITGFI